MPQIALRNLISKVVYAEDQKRQKRQPTYLQSLEQDVVICQRVADVPPRKAHLAKVLQELEADEDGDEDQITQGGESPPDPRYYNKTDQVV